MRHLVTGSAGHLGEALMRSLRAAAIPCTGLDARPSAFTDIVASVTDRAALGPALAGVTHVHHAATLHKPHLGSHAMADFLEVNVGGTLLLLEEAARAGVRAFVLSSSTTVFGAALSAPPGAPAAWIDEDVRPVPKNIYGVTKRAAEDLAELFARTRGLPAVALRLARFFPEPDDDPARRASLGDANLKAVEFLHRRVDLADAVSAHLRAAARAEALGWGCFVVSATTPFLRTDAALLGRDAGAALAARLPDAASALARLGWRMPGRLDRVYDNARARAALGWAPATDFAAVLARAAAGRNPLGPLAEAVGVKDYHAGWLYAAEPMPVQDGPGSRGRP